MFPNLLNTLKTGYLEELNVDNPLGYNSKVLPVFGDLIKNFYEKIERIQLLETSR